MKLKEIESVLNQLPKLEPALKDIKGSTISIIINDKDDNNVGYDVNFHHSGLRITKFQREPYKTYEIMSAYEKLTVKQSNFVRHNLISNYFPELDYLL